MSSHHLRDGQDAVPQRASWPHMQGFRGIAGGENVLLAGAELFLCSANLGRLIRRFTGHPVRPLDGQ